MSTIRARAVARLLPLLLAALLLLVGCSTGQTVGAVAQPIATVTPTVTVAQASPAPTSSPTTQPTAVTPSPTTATASPSPVPSATTAAAPSTDTTTAVKAVIQQANAAQQQAFAANDPTLMRATATDAYYSELVQTNQAMADNGVAAIALVQLEWGTVAQQSSTSVEVTTFETWRTTYTDSTTEQGRDQNIYTVVLQDGAWKIQADLHPDTTLDQPTPGSTGSGGTAPAPTDPTGSTNATDPSVSSNWSGYAATGGTVTAVSGTWTVPEISATSTASADATWVGIGGVTSHDLIQAGTQATVSGGRVLYSAWVEMLPATSRSVPLTVNPGDTVSVSIAQQDDGTWLIAMQNQTTGQNYQVTETYTSTRSSAEWIEEAPSAGQQVVALDNFGTVQFQASSAVMDGQQVTITGAGGTAITMINRTGQALATPSALGADGASFSVQRTAVSTTTPSTTTPRRGR